MAGRVAEAVSPVRVSVRPETGDVSLPDDASLLKIAVRESIRTSPEAFLKTMSEVEATGPDAWHEKLDRQTWVVIEQGSKVVGIATAKFPDEKADPDINPGNARFIESVWISPEFRKMRLGERLISFLIERERMRYPGVRQFFLWVIEDNKYAIALYERMGFRYYARQNETRKKLAGYGDRWELQYRLDLPESWEGEAEQRATAWLSDSRQCGITYRMLGKEPA